MDKYSKFDPTTTQAEPATCLPPTPMSVGLVGQYGCRVSLKERAEKAMCHHQQEVEKQGRILELLKKHPEFEEYEQLRELLGR